MSTILWLLAVVLACTTLAYVNIAGWVWVITFAAALGVAWVAHALPVAAVIVLAVVLVVAAARLQCPANPVARSSAIRC